MWKDLSEFQKNAFIAICNDNFGSTNVVSCDGEPLYFDGEGKLIDTKKVYDFVLLLPMVGFSLN